MGVPWHELLQGQFRVDHIAAALQYIGKDYGNDDVPGRPPLSRWGCSAKLGGVWLCSGLLFVAAWFGMFLLARVALPRSCELRGMGEEEARRSGRSIFLVAWRDTILLLLLMPGMGPREDRNGLRPSKHVRHRPAQDCRACRHRVRLAIKPPHLDSK